jgi:hypothetical protein
MGKNVYTLRLGNAQKFCLLYTYVVHTREYIHTYIHIHTNTHTNIYTHIHTCTHTYTHIYTYVHTYVRTYIRTHTLTYIHTYTYTHSCSFITACVCVVGNYFTPLLICSLFNDPSSVTQNIASNGRIISK